MTTNPTHIANTERVTMTDTRTFGRILGETAQAARRVHRHVLTRAGTDFESWVAFTLLTENAPSMPKQALIAELTRRLHIERSASSHVLERLAAAGHVLTRGDGGTEQIELTPAGEVHLRGVRQAVNQASQRLIGHLDRRDVETAMNVLRAVGEAAQNLTAASPTSP